MHREAIIAQLRFRALSEERPALAWTEIVRHGWPGWREWFLKRRSSTSPNLVDCRRALRRHLPGIEALWDELASVGSDDDLAMFLSFWTPPKYLVNCSQVALTDDRGPLLIRNYDLDPQLNEATLFRSRWLGRGVIGMVEGMAGLSDGMNDSGLVASITFGGRVTHGEGFGIPFIIRYLLEFCRDVQDAVSVLREIPCHMSYNVTLTDPSGAVATVMLSPDRPAIVQQAPWATNHQLGVEWPKHGRITQTVERAEYLQALLASGQTDEVTLKAAFLAAPLFSNRYREGFGTVFTSIYRPVQKTVQLGWRSGGFHSWDFSAAAPEAVAVTYNLHGSTADRSGIAPHSQPSTNDRRNAFALRNLKPEANGWTNLNAFTPQTTHQGNTG